jgi:hypothetical protein
MGTPERGAGLVNTHVHLPPNFSAFASVADGVQAAAAEGLKAMGISNFFDQHVYAGFAAQAEAAGVRPLFGLEFITLDPVLEAAGLRANDPANPGRMYVCGKGIDPFRERPARAEAIAQAIRQGNDQRAAAQVAQVAAHFAAIGCETGLTADVIVSQVAAAAGVRREWVSLQERHIARAFQEAVFTLPAARREEVLTKAFGGPPKSPPSDVTALQGEIRSRLLKAGTPGFVAEVPLSFADAYYYVTALGGIPTYPVLADGADPVCEYEADPADLARKLAGRGFHAAELIPLRNRSAVVDEYVAAFLDAGLIVMAGTEHNTPDRIPLEPACLDGPVSPASRQAFWDGACVVAAHQREVAQGRPGFVDAEGRRTAVETAELARLGRALMEGK